jgi:hypothetical protein
MTPCWGYHYSAIPAETERIVDGQNRMWHRAGPRSWSLPDQLARFHESWLLGECSPIRCASTEDLLERRDAKLHQQLIFEDDSPYVWLPDQQAGDEPVIYEDAMMLMRAGWLAWPPKQRREALEALCQSEMDEVAKTS